MCQNRRQNCCERKLELPTRVTEMLPDTSDNTYSDASDATAASNDKEQLVIKTLSQCTNLLSLCHFIKHHQKPRVRAAAAPSSQMLLKGCAEGA